MADKSQDLGVAEKSYSISFANMEGRKFYFGTIINLGIVLGNKKYFLDGDGTLSVSPKRGGKGCRKRREQNRAVTKQTERHRMIMEELRHLLERIARTLFRYLKENKQRRQPEVLYAGTN